MRQQYSLLRLVAKACYAAALLAAARVALRRITPQAVLTRNQQIAALAALSSRATDPVEITHCCNEAAFFITRMAARVPWRSDCLVQALAGQQWLARAGIVSKIVIGTAKCDDGGLEAHAWLHQQRQIVMGGNISGYQRLL